jgi:hypothetical protein
VIEAEARGALALVVGQSGIVDRLRVKIRRVHVHLA